MNTAVQVIVAVLPSAACGFFVWLLERRINKRDDKEKIEREKRQAELDKREAAREQNLVYLIKSVDASMSLAEATAKAVERIPDAHCNGDMHAALDYAAKVRNEQRSFLTEQAIEALQN